MAGETFAKFVKVADIPMDREKLAMYFNTITYNDNQINRTYTNNFTYFQQSINDIYKHNSTYYISTDNTIIANGKCDRQYRLDNQYFRQANSIVEDYNEFGFFDNPAVNTIPEFESTFYIQEVNANKVFDMYLTNEVNYIKLEMLEFWKSSKPNFVDEFPIVTIDYQSYIYLKNGQAIQGYQAVGYYQDYFITYDSIYEATFIRLRDMQTFYLEIADDFYYLFDILVNSFYLFIYNNELYCVIFHGLEDDSNFPNIYSKVYKITIIDIDEDVIIATYTLVDDYTNQTPIIWAIGSDMPLLMSTNIYKHISFNDMLHNPVITDNMFLNAILQHTYIVDSIYPTLSTYQDKYLVFTRMRNITQSSSNLYIRDNIIFDKSLDPNGRPIFYFVDPDYQLAYDSVTNQVITSPGATVYRLSYNDILNGTYNRTYITFINNARELVGAHNGWFYYIEIYWPLRKLRRFNYTTLASEDIITGITLHSAVYHIQINSTLYIWFVINALYYRIYKIDMMSPSATLYVDVPLSTIPLFFDIPANNIFDSQFNLLEFDFVNHTYTSRRILESIDTDLIIAINDSGLYKILPNENYFEYGGAESFYGEHDSPYIDKFNLLDYTSITKMNLTSTQYRSTYSIYKLVYANDLSLDEPKTLETTIR